MRWIVSLLFILTVGFVSAQESLPLVSRWEPGIRAGALLYADTVGFSSTAEVVAVLNPPQVWNPELGFGVVYQFTAPDNHNQHDVYGFVAGGVRWTPEDTWNLHARLGVGGGYTYDDASFGSNGVFGGLVQATVGAEVPWGSVIFQVSATYQLIITEPTVKATIIPALGIRFVIPTTGGSK